MRNNKKDNDSVGKQVVIKDNSTNKPVSSDTAIAPPDGGYGWVIVIASFFISVITDGIIFTVGEALVKVWENDFRTTVMQASIAPSLLFGFYLLSGPLASALANIFGLRLVVIAGALTTFVGFILSSFVPSLILLYITFGVIGGIGFGMVYLPSVVIVNQYFEKKRALAMGITVCGSGIGTTVFSQVFPNILKLCKNSWRSFLVCVAFITLSLVICGLCYRESPSVASSKEAEKTALITSEKKPELKIAQTNVNARKLNAYIDIYSPKFSTASDPTINIHHALRCPTIHFYPALTQDKKTKSDIELSKTYGKESDWNWHLSNWSDACYSRSISNLEKKMSRRNSWIPKRLVMTTITTTQIIPRAAKWQLNLRSILRSMIDTSLLSNPSFVLIAITGFLTLFCLFVPFIFLGKQAVKVGANAREQSYLLLSMGIVNFFGRIICGAISAMPKVDPLLVHNVAVISAGLATCSVPLLTHYWMYLIYTIPFACGVACFSALRSVICVELLGLDKLSNAFGMLMFCMGVAAFIGPPVAALLKDLSGNFDMSFYLMGVLLTLSGVLCIPLRKLNSISMSNGSSELETSH